MDFAPLFGFLMVGFFGLKEMIKNDKLRKENRILRDCLDALSKEAKELRDKTKSFTDGL